MYNASRSLTSSVAQYNVLMHYRMVYIPCIWAVICQVTVVVQITKQINGICMFAETSKRTVERPY
jgi:hypothetical protein